MAQGATYSETTVAVLLFLAVSGCMQEATERPAPTSPPPDVPLQITYNCNGNLGPYAENCDHRFSERGTVHAGPAIAAKNRLVVIGHAFQDRNTVAGGDLYSGGLQISHDNGKSWSHHLIPTPQIPPGVEVEPFARKTYRVLPFLTTDGEVRVLAMVQIGLQKPVYGLSYSASTESATRWNPPDWITLGTKIPTSISGFETPAGFAASWFEDDQQAGAGLVRLAFEDQSWKAASVAECYSTSPVTISSGLPVFVCAQKDGDRPIELRRLSGNGSAEVVARFERDDLMLDNDAELPPPRFGAVGNESGLLIWNITPTFDTCRNSLVWLQAPTFSAGRILNLLDLLDATKAWRLCHLYELALGQGLAHLGLALPVSQTSPPFLPNGEGVWLAREEAAAHVVLSIGRGERIAETILLNGSMDPRPPSGGVYFDVNKQISLSSDGTNVSVAFEKQAGINLIHARVLPL